MIRRSPPSTTGSTAQHRLLCAMALIVAIHLPAAGGAQAGTLSDPIYANGFEQSCGIASYSENFTQPDGAGWPIPWVAVGGVALADIQTGRARLRPTASAYSVARMRSPLGSRDVEVRFSFTLEHEPTQGVGFGVRQNGGYLTQTNPMGQGYAVFLEGSFRGLAGIGLWKEENGVETQLAHSPPSVAGPSAGITYRVRFRTHQINATTTGMQARFWPASGIEPEGWQVSVTDSTAVLQNITGVFASDSWSSIQNPAAITAHTFVDDIQIEPLCNPIVQLGAAQLVSQAFQFTEGPLWRGTHLLFTDIPANTIYRLDPPSTISVFRNPSDQANGLALDAGGNLLAAENITRSVSITDFGSGVRSALVSTYQGMRFNSPNDLNLRADGTLYFTDPDYGLVANPPAQRELPFNGLFRRNPDGVLVLEWAGTIGVNQPNGASLSPGGDLLFVTDTQQGTLRRYNVAADGSLSNLRILMTGLNTPDGMCVDANGNVYIGVASGIEIVSPEGARWGGIAVPRITSNCAFGDSDGRSIYLTARQGLYRIR
ncbi:MAG: SMP-30/gluconolactonase/LRE family protein [Pseudomonadota bacterium]|nr:SMP-30/gluconolactonase/LRE family protein [Pseudomonadota bacterium]